MFSLQGHGNKARWKGTGQHALKRLRRSPQRNTLHTSKGSLWSTAIDDGLNAVSTCYVGWTFSYVAVMALSTCHWSCVYHSYLAMKLFWLRCRNGIDEGVAVTHTKHYGKSKRMCFPRDMGRSQLEIQPAGFEGSMKVPQTILRKETDQCGEIRKLWSVRRSLLGIQVDCLWGMHGRVMVSGTQIYKFN